MSRQTWLQRRGVSSVVEPEPTRNAADEVDLWPLKVTVWLRNRPTAHRSKVNAASSQTSNLICELILYLSLPVSDSQRMPIFYLMYIAMQKLIYFNQRPLFVVLLISLLLSELNAFGHDSESGLGTFMMKSPESTDAPPGDEVQLECELNLPPDNVEFRFRPQNSKPDEKDRVINIHNINKMVKRIPSQKCRSFCIIFTFLSSPPSTARLQHNDTRSFIKASRVCESEDHRRLSLRGLVRRICARLHFSETSTRDDRLGSERVEQANHSLEDCAEKQSHHSMWRGFIGTWSRVELLQVSSRS